jgi:hypothetical protein
MSTEAEHEGGTTETQQSEQAEQDRNTEHEILSPCLVVPDRPTEQYAIPMGGTGPVEQVRPMIIRERVVYRERERVEVGLVGWVREHPGAAHQAVAWLIAAVLIGVASLG